MYFMDNPKKEKEKAYLVVPLFIQHFGLKCACSILCLFYFALYSTNDYEFKKIALVSYSFNNKNKAAHIESR